MTASFLIVSMAAWLATADAAPDRSDHEACALATSRFTASHRLPISRIGLCDVLPAERSPRGYAVLALHSTRQCDGICSTLLGWFAVERANGRVFEWDVAEWRRGVEITVRR